MISVIIPIYNVRSFIERGLRNVLKQTYQDYEILLSDDGSTDGSYEECRKWALKDSRIRVLHQENRGAGAARNHGINEAKGEFIYFFDIDDEISPNLFDYCVRTMIEKDVDFICFGYDNVETTYNSKVTVSFPEVRTSSNSEFRDLFVDHFVLKVNGFPWNKFYRKLFLDKHHLRYEDQRIQQDEVFNLKCYHYLERAYLSPEVLYTYYVYEKGNTRSYFIPERFDIYKSVRGHFEALKSFWNLKDKRFDDYLNKRFYTSVMQCMLFNMTHPLCPWTKQQKHDEMKRIMSDPLTLQSFHYAENNIEGLEQCLYRKACKDQSLFQITLYTSVFGMFHNVRRLLK
jgi:glycosyltransferase involved in cell wall biosynthesis